MKFQLFKVSGLICIFLILFPSCNHLKKVVGKRDMNILLKKSEVFKNQFTGFVLFDPAECKILLSHQGHLLYTPASNTKILTAYACLQTLGDSLPTFLYQKINDTTHLAPFGDPSFLHPDFPQLKLIRQIQNQPIQLHFPPSVLSPFGPGWAWDDYQYDFQTERSWMPVYGNEVRILKEDSLKIIPTFFQDYTQIYTGEKPGNFVYREKEYNLFNIWMKDDTTTFERKIPFETSNELLQRLLTDTLHADVSFSEVPYLTRPDTLYNTDLISALVLMMLRSDNFLAEQLLVVAARKSGYYNIDAFRNHMIEHWELPTDVRWVDGSGLSRYNLVSPLALTQVLNGIYQMSSWDDIQSIFPTGGVSGTIKNWYGTDEPYVFAKTGTLSNNHCLSGFIKTRTGKVLIFSLMNNHYIRPVKEIKMNIQNLLEIIRDSY